MTSIADSFARSPTAAFKTLFDSSAQTVHRLLRTLAVRRTAMRLRELDDRTLCDIGLTRSEITSIAYGLGHDTSRRVR
jgi:uncharacterized protein YjiS (DUF1127 family)